MRRTAFFSVLLFACLSAAYAAAGDEVVRVHRVEPAQMNALRQVGDVWGRNWRDDYVLMLVAPNEREALERLGYAVETDVEETARLRDFLAVDREAWQLLGDGIPGFPCYRTVDETHATLADLVAAHPQYARLELIGQTWQALNNDVEGDIFALVIGNQESPYEQSPLVVMAAMHARELTTAEAATRFAELLLAERETDGDIAWLLDHREIHVIPQENPDGRRQVELGETFWRKNYNETACPGGSTGVDLNRNSTFLWGMSSSSNECSETYRGTSPASEPETMTMEDYLDGVFERQWPPGSDPPDTDEPVPNDARGVFLSLHSSGGMVLIPWEGLGGQNENNAPNHDELTILGRKFGFHTNYAVARWALLGPAGGTTVDYAHGEFGVAAYTFELGTSFFQSCQSFESTVWPDVRDALVYAAKAAELPYQSPWGPDVLDLEAVFDPGTGQVDVSATADDTRYFRGSVSEPPAVDPVFAVTEAVASFDVPPHLADTTHPLTLGGSGTVVGLSGAIPLVGGTGEPRLLFVAATDAEGHTGPPTATWVSGLGEPAAALDFDPTSLDFGDVEVGTTGASLPVTLHNTGDADATGLTFSPPGNGFDVETVDCGATLAAGEDCQIDITFTPPAAGPASAAVDVGSNEGATAALALDGNGVVVPTELSPAGFAVDSSAIVSDGNGVFEPGESVEVAPAWHNGGIAAQSAAGIASDLSGPPGATYSLVHDEAEYGSVEPGLTASCQETGVCYQMGVNDPAVRPAAHWDAIFGETLSAETSHTWALHLGDSFTDVPRTSGFYSSVETLLHHGITGGCTGTEYCPGANNTRAQMPVFVLRALEGADYVPPACVEGSEVFGDVPFDHPFCAWIEELANRGVVAGCGGGNYCPNAPVTRGQIAIFLLRTLEGSGYTPPPCTGLFADVACPSAFADWIEELYNREITGGCGSDPLRYCPAKPVNRQQMAVFVSRTFGLTLYGP